MTAAGDRSVNGDEWMVNGAEGLSTNHQSPLTNHAAPHAALSREARETLRAMVTTALHESKTCAGHAQLYALPSNAMLIVRVETRRQGELLEVLQLLTEMDAADSLATNHPSPPANHAAATAEVAR